MYVLQRVHFESLKKLDGYRSLRGPRAPHAPYLAEDLSWSYSWDYPPISQTVRDCEKSADEE